MTIVGMNLFLLGSVLLKGNSWPHFFVAFI
jgi:hypothetical protein